MTEISNNISSCNYLYWFLNDLRLNELLWRVTRGKLKSDILAEIADNPFNNNYNIKVKLSSHINDLYILVGVLDGSQNIFHMTFHLLFNCNNSSNHIGPLHIRNNINTNKASRINVILPQNLSNERLIFHKSNYPISGYNNVSIEITELSDAILNVFNKYFSKDNALSLDIITNSQIHTTLRNIIIYFKSIRGRSPIRQTTFTKGQFGGIAPTLVGAIEPAIAGGTAPTLVGAIEPAIAGGTIQHSIRYGTRKKRYNKRKTRKSKK